MAKKTRPRRPVKKAARKAARKTKRQTPAQKAAQREAELRASLRQVDPYHLDERLIPVGWRYQWMPVAIAPGWYAVPYSRHAHDFPRSYNEDGRIVHKGLVLQETSVENVSKSVRAGILAAKDMEHDLARRVGVQSLKLGEAHLFPILPESFLATKAIPPEAHHVDGDPVETPVSLLIRIPRRWVAAAAYLDLSISEYARRRIVGERMIVGCMDGHVGNLQAVYEPISLNYSPKEVQ